MDEVIRARTLWGRLCEMGEGDKAAWLEAHEFSLDGEWRACNNADVVRAVNTPLFLYTDWPDGEYRIPMDDDVRARRKQ